MDASMEKTLKNFESHGIKARYFETGEQARQAIAQAVQGKKVAFGGSVTLQQLGFYEALEQNNSVFWHWVTPIEKRREREKECEVFFTSANALSCTGEIVNIDGTGNRVTMAAYGPEKVYYICGVNKLCPDTTSAIDRAQNVAAPQNAKRLGLDTPCVKDGVCHNCQSPQRICNVMDITLRRPGAVEVELWIIQEELGY